MVAEEGSHSIPSPEDWWSTVLGTGYRGTVEQLDPDERERVRVANLAVLRERGVSAVEANVLYAVVTKG